MNPPNWKNTVAAQERMGWYVAFADDEPDRVTMHRPIHNGTILETGYVSKSDAKFRVVEKVNPWNR